MQSTEPIDVLRSIGIAPDHISSSFFSRRNIEMLHNMIRFRVYENTSSIIDKQSENDLLLIMRDVYLSENIRPDLPSTPQIVSMNNATLSKAVAIVVSGVRHHSWYMRDACSQAVPVIPRPEHLSMKGSRSLSALRL
jgi:hypothetical protein